MKKGTLRFALLFSFIALMNVKTVFAQMKEVNWQVLSPVPGMPIQVGDYLFISVSVNDTFNFDPEEIRIYLDGIIITPNLRVNKNKLSAISSAPLSVGKHRIEIWARFLNEVAFKYYGWNIDVGASASDEASKKPTLFKGFNITGRIDLDDREEMLSGPGAYLRQEPKFTRTANINLEAKYKDLMIPIRFFGTSDNGSGDQSRNFFQTGVVYKGLEVLYGDINPTFDKLVLTGVRIKGLKAGIKWRNSAIMVVTGDLNQAKEGVLSTYTGSGFQPPNMYDSTRYISTNGTYRRTATAVRMEFGNRKDYYKIGFTGLKATDDINSIKYGVNPQQNLSGSTDLYINLFDKVLNFNGGAAVSIITNDISKGPLDKARVDSTFKTQLPLDPATLKDIIIINTSTVPLNITDGGNTAYYGQMNFIIGSQALTADYRKVGSVFQSLGNPFLKTNYEGYNVTERFWLWKRKFIASFNYQAFSNGLSTAEISKINTVIYSGNVMLNLNEKIPQFFGMFSNQDRNTTSAAKVADYAKVNDNLRNWSAGMNYTRELWKIKHNIRFMYTNSVREDLVRNDVGTDMNSLSGGITENFLKKYSIGFQYSRTFLKDKSGMTLNNVNTYTGMFQYDIIYQKFGTIFTYSHSISEQTEYTSSSLRMSAIGKLYYKLYKGMMMTAEYGYQPYIENSALEHNYNDQYFYIRYSYDLNAKN